jgi:hypothetical protein
MLTGITSHKTLHEGMSFSAEIAHGLYLKVLWETFSTNDVMKDCLLLKNQVDIINEANPSWDSKRTSDMLCEAFLTEIKHGTKRYARPSQLHCSTRTSSSQCSDMFRRSVRSRYITRNSGM